MYSAQICLISRLLPDPGQAAVFLFGGIILKSLNRAIDRFCARHPRFGIPNLMIYIITGNVIVFLFTMMDRTQTFLSYLYFNPTLILQGQVWRLLTFLFIPANNNIIFMALMLYFYYFIGSTLERHWGAGRFTIFYFSGVFLTILYGFLAGFLTNSSYIYLDAAYLNLSMFFAFATMFPDMRVLLFFLIPIKIKWLAIADALFFAWEIAINAFPINLLPLVAIANYFIFCGDDLIRYIKPYRASNSKQAINFRKAARQAKKDASNKPYRHKCSVCGKTDADYPNLEFRYCSRCAGYHCFCADHINNHEHFKD